ncbi:MAG: DEAD/DEAH box helicase family protein [candidate division WOR-3 bacterium]
MAKIFLQDIIEDFRFEELPANWNSFDLEGFSKKKRLWDYQQEAVKNAIKILWKYFEDFADYQKDEKLEINQIRKQKFLEWYKDNGLEEDLSIKLDKRKRSIFNLLTEYYQPEDNKIPYENFINRMCFWMATGSGKSLVIIKLIQIINTLIERGELPRYDILILTHRDDLIDQLRRHIDEFNYANEPKIILKELKEYPEVKRQQQLFGITVFYYRSDNLSDEQKEKIIDFKNYDNDGKWFIFLDEAHKGDKEESKRQHIYSILSRNGFLFNSSATFIDPRDIITCAYEFNLASFINAGYGKHIAILKQELRAFRDEEDYSGEEKQKIVLKSLILLTYVKKFYEKVKRVQKGLYHNPLLLTLVNSVNIEEADLKLFFREIERIGKGEIDAKLFKTALNELWDELKQEPEFMFEKGNKVKIEKEVFKGITKNDVIKYVYNSKSCGEIEILIRPSDKKELAFKLKTSEKPFALVKIGDISGWLKEELEGYEISERYEEESYFESLNREDSDINILMGSRSFYEGWDSNRPNVINYINIGTGEDAKKFILQSVGRGVRIEPIKNERKRILSLYNADRLNYEDLFNKIKDKVLPIETLFIFGTNRKALETVIGQLEKEKSREGEAQLSLFVNYEAKKQPLLVPTYKQADYPILKSEKKVKFEITEDEFALLKSFLNFVDDDRILLMKVSEQLRNMPVEKLKVLRESIGKKEDFYKTGERSYKNLDILLQRILEHLSVIPQEFDKLKILEDEIKHFQNIKVYLKDISEIQNKIETVRDYPDKKRELVKELSKVSDKARQKFEDLLAKEATATYEYENQKIYIKYIPNHYYFPIILSEKEKIDYIKHIITTPSEVNFINALENYLDKADNKFKEFDWWYFSKLDASLDEVYIPYYNPNINNISKFNPDFIFWLKKDKDYFILFVDPKGTEHTNAYRKIDGYKELFEEAGKTKVFNYNGFKTKIKLQLRPKDVARASAEYRQYWFDNIEKMFDVLK